MSYSKFEFTYIFCTEALLTNYYQKSLLNIKKSGVHLLRIAVLCFFPLYREFSSSLFPRLAPPPPSILSLYTLMDRLEQTRARIRKEQEDRTQKRLQQLRVQEGRETLLVEKKIKELSDRTLSLSHQTQSLSRSLFEARREAFILRHQTERLSRSYSLLSRLCYLSCVCLAFCLLFLFVVLCDERWLHAKSSGLQRLTMVGNLQERQETERLVQFRDNLRNHDKKDETRFYRPME